MKVKVRFYLLPTLLLAAFVTSLTVAVITASSARLHALAEESARTLFSQIAGRNADVLQAMVSGASDVVRTQSQLEPRRIVAGDTLDAPALVPAMIAALHANPNLYSLYFGLANGAFLQVVAVSDNPGLSQDLDAPAGTAFAARLIQPGAAASGARPDHWQFLADNERLIGSATRSTTFEARGRQWYTGAQTGPGLFVSQPYLYALSQTMGITLSAPLPQHLGVFGADLSLVGLNAYAAASLEDREGGIVVTDDLGRILAAHATPSFGDMAPAPLETAARSANPFIAATGRFVLEDGSRIVPIHAELFAYASRSVRVSARRTLHVIAFAPMRLYAGPIERVRNQITLCAALLLLIFLPLAWLVSRRIAGALGSLTAESERIKRLDFSGEQAVQSMFYEIDLLGEAQHTMKTAIRERTEALDEAMARLESLLESGMQLASRRTTEQVLEQTLQRARRLANAQAGQFWLCAEDGGLRLAANSRLAEAGAPLPPLEIAAGKAPRPGALDPCAWVAAHREPLWLDAARAHDYDLAIQHVLLGHEPLSLLAVPVLTQGEKTVGVLVLADVHAHGAYARDVDAGLVRYAQMLAAQAGLALENIQLIDSQRALMESLLQLIAGAIDAKSAYTGGHCARVPELARMLAEAASDARDGPLASFRFETEEQWREFRIGTWLHDCGKVTTPEFVVDKATKLETIYNRIHEIRTRFEVLLRDAEIDCLKATLAGGDADAARAAFEVRRAQLVEDFAFLAQCNIGAESQAPARTERLREIGAQTWLRHFDDRLGLSHIEAARFDGRPPAALPARETLLADKPEHIVPRTEQQRYDPRHGFRMEVPEHLYHFGELYNLSISRGTLTVEERYKINEHIVQTIVMLEQLPLPPNMRRVPEYAGTHHESLRGTGYPRKLSGAALSIPARIMAIADIFEALTASDRPYKKAKPLSEAVRLLATFKKNGHIDGALFDLFLTSGTYLRYAEAFLAPEQIDAVDIAAYLGILADTDLTLGAG
ncbi:MAG: HD domain-containing phosphohydrolase [Pararobbsia sp.]